MEGGVISIFTVSILVQSDIMVVMGSSLVVLQPIDVLVLLVAVGVRAVDEYGGGAGPVQLWRGKGVRFPSRERECGAGGVGSHSL